MDQLNFLQVLLEGGGVSLASIDKCVQSGTQSGEEVNFGDASQKNVCGTLSAEQGELGSSEEYTSLFQQHGGNESLDWNKTENHGEWTKQCLDNSTSSGAITLSSEQSTQYLGLCRGTDMTSVKFVKKEQKAEGSEDAKGWKLWVCNDNCGTSSTDNIGTVKTYTAENQSSWKQVQFYNKS